MRALPRPMGRYSVPLVFAVDVDVVVILIACVLHFLVRMLLTLERKGTRDASEAMTQLRKCYRYYVPSSPRTPAARPLHSSCTLKLCKQPYLKAILRSFHSTGFGQFFGSSERLSSRTREKLTLRYMLYPAIIVV